ncbi:hypothetical protein Tco_1242133 [Tanacetum coccineum]
MSSVSLGILRLGLGTQENLFSSNIISLNSIIELIEIDSLGLITKNLKALECLAYPTKMHSMPLSHKVFSFGSRSLTTALQPQTLRYTILLWSIRGIRFMDNTNRLKIQSIHSIAALVITISSDASEEGGGSVVSQVIHFSTIPTKVPIIPDMPIDLPTTPELPAVSPFLCSDDSESKPADELPERHVSPGHFSAMISRWRAKVTSRPSSPSGSLTLDTIVPSTEISVAPIPPASSTEIATAL